ncbi:MAG: rRNA pseudouridine synthase [Sulfurovum sp.]|nr:rRNA pseudouridine synthase [Sulfurovum sp.]MCB4757833.1 rRNA pseudouridine synthase [Sulfurovum sp.]MCB4774194.1 rRNA pseudouridine synthase [Sulfurovum sp.]MCB4777651.1 rRNA pseudouridine synthase [Sulfurovum sp.]MCB4782497.1 rRNA pseudouridine synthase [Sulfurovum sp.]
MRLNKYIAHNTKYSRRDADKLIEMGEVTLNRHPIREFGYKVQPTDHIFIKGQIIKEKGNKVTVLVYNKPKGVLVTKKDDRGRTTIYHKLPGKFRHFTPIGRLDFASEGLLLLTDNVEVATVLMGSKLDRTYNLKIDKPVTEEMVVAMKEGLVLDDARAGAHEKSKIHSMEFAPFVAFDIRSEGKNYTKIRVTINEGKNRELRRFFAHFDTNVLDLKRVSFGGIELDNLPTNKTRFFTRREYDDLHTFLKQYKKEAKRELRKAKAKPQE